MRADRSIPDGLLQPAGDVPDGRPIIPDADTALVLLTTREAEIPGGLPATRGVLRPEATLFPEFPDDAPMQDGCLLADLDGAFVLVGPPF